MDLVQTLKTQHLRLEEKCAALNTRLEESDLPGAQALFVEVCAEFAAHVQLENEKLYPELLAKVEASPELKGQGLLAKSFADGVGIITDALGRVTARHAQTPSIETFASDWATLLHALRSRMGAEESSLYPMFTRLVTKAR